MATLSFTVNGVAAPATASVEFLVSAASPADVHIAAAPTSIIADGSSASTVTVTLRDANGNRPAGRW